MSTNLVIPADLAALKAAGFAPPVPKPLKTPRIAVATSGRTKSGKSHWSIMTTPEPVAYIMADPGSLQLADKAVARGRKVIPLFIEHSKKESQDQAKLLWQKYRKAIQTVLGAKSIRTLVIDTETEMWELLQMAEFGKLKQNNKFAYGALNAEFSGIVENAYYARPDLNLVVISKVKKLNTKGKPKADGQDMGGDWDGKTYETKGYKDMDYLVDLSIRHGFAERQFYFETNDSEATRFGGEYSGLKFAGPECSFTDLALHVFKDADKCRELGFEVSGCDPEYWGVSLW